MTILAAAERARLFEEGYLVRHGVFSEKECAAMCGAVSRIISDAARSAIRARRVPSFWESFAASAQRTEVFFDPRRDDLLSLAPDEWESAVMRVGHTLHRDEEMACTIRDERIAHVLRAAIDGSAEIAQSSLIYKQPSSDLVQFGWHQDSSYLPHDPESIVLAFVALDEMTVENGALEVLPGSHRLPLGVTYRLDREGFVPAGSRERTPDTSRAATLEVGRGAVILVLGRTYHASRANRSSGPRRAMIVHAKACASRMSPLAWSRGPFDPLL